MLVIVKKSGYLKIFFRPNTARPMSPDPKKIMVAGACLMVLLIFYVLTWPIVI